MMNRSVSVDSPGLPVRGSNPFGDASDRRPRASAGAIETTPTIATVGAAAPSAASLFEDDESDTATLTSVPTTTATTTTPRNRKVSRAGSLNADIERRGTPSINNRVPPPVANTRSSLFDSAFDDDDERGILGAEDMV